jgi:hypothetical protein
LSLYCSNLQCISISRFRLYSTGLLAGSLLAARIFWRISFRSSFIFFSLYWPRVMESNHPALPRINAPQSRDIHYLEDTLPKRLSHIVAIAYSVEDHNVYPLTSFEWCM